MDIGDSTFPEIDDMSGGNWSCAGNQVESFGARMIVICYSLDFKYQVDISIMATRIGFIKSPEITLHRLGLSHSMQ